MTIGKNILGLKGRVAIVTGAATGLGAATAAILASAGARVLINHMPGQEDLAQGVSEQCQHLNDGRGALCFVGDVTDDEACQSMARTAQKAWGSIDVLVNNAGFNKPVAHDDLDGLSAADFNAFFSVHVIGPYQMIRAVSPVMQMQGKGAVVNVSSAAGENGFGSSVAYSASKGATNTMTKSLGRALAPTIRVNAVCPGFIDTPIWDKLNLSPEEREVQRRAKVAETPLKLESSPEIVARSILFLASDLAAHLTGQLITSDGGLLLGVYETSYKRNEPE